MFIQADENEKKELKDFSVIHLNIKLETKIWEQQELQDQKRMDYSKVISVMKYINKN